MMKARPRAGAAEQVASSSRAKQEALGANGANNQQTTAQARKRRSSINVYDQPSSLNSRLRQLETDMLRLDEDRNRLVDETHASLAQYELKLSEIHAIIKSRQDNVERYVEDMRMLLLAKEEFEKQAKSLNEKHDRIHEKFMHRETIISREIKLLKNKFEILEKNRQFRTMLQKSSPSGGDTALNDDLNSGLDGSVEGASRKRSETGTTLTASELNSLGPSSGGIGGGIGAGGGDERRPPASSTAGRKNVRIKMSNLGGLGQIFEPLIRLTSRPRKGGNHSRRGRRKSNKVASITSPSDNGETHLADGLNSALAANHLDSAIDPADVMNPAATALGATADDTGGDLSSQLVNSATATPPARDKSKKTSLMGRLFSKSKR